MDYAVVDRRLESVVKVQPNANISLAQLVSDLDQVLFFTTPFFPSRPAWIQFDGT